MVVILIGLNFQNVSHCIISQIQIIGVGCLGKVVPEVLGANITYAVRARFVLIT